MWSPALSVVLVVTFFLSGCDGGDPGGPSSTEDVDSSFEVTYDLSGDGIGGRSYGSVTMSSDGRRGEICWELTIEGLPKAVQLHVDETGPVDPVVRTLYDPPGRRVRSACRSLAMGVATNARHDPEGFYIDGHNRDSDPTPVLWASLEEVDG